MYITYKIFPPEKFATTQSIQYYMSYLLYSFGEATESSFGIDGIQQSTWIAFHPGYID